MLNQPFLGKGSESFNSIDIDLPLLEFITMLNIEMLVATEHERVISPPFVYVHDRASPHPLHRFRHETIR
mgnify:FL=1